MLKTREDRAFDSEEYERAMREMWNFETNAGTREPGLDAEGNFDSGGF